MPTAQNPWFFLGAAVVAAAVGIVSAAGMFIAERYRQESQRHGMARDLARLDQQLTTIKKELDHLKVTHRGRPHGKKKNTPTSTKNMSVLSTTSEDYTSALDLDSSDLEFYDLSDEENGKNGENTFHSILDEITEILNCGNISKINDALEKLNDMCLEYPEEFELLWRIGKAHYSVANATSDLLVKQENIEKGIVACSQALVLNQNSAETHKWYAILVGSRSDFQTMKERILDGHLFKKHVDIALELDPNDASLHHMLGRFAYEVAGLKWYERKAAAALYSEPPTATYEDALHNFLNADKLSKTGWKENKLLIGKCHIALGNFKEAVCWLDRANDLELLGELNEKVDADINFLLSKYSSHR